MADYQGYRLTGLGYCRRSGERLIQVHALGGPGEKIWAFSIWLDGECLAGRSDPKWSAKQAQKAADKADAAIRQ